MRTIFLLLCSVSLNAQVLIGLSVGTNQANYQEGHNQDEGGTILTTSKINTSFQASLSLKSAKEGWRLGCDVNYRERSNVLFIQPNVGKTFIESWYGRFDVSFISLIGFVEYKKNHFFVNLGPFFNLQTTDRFTGAYNYMYLYANYSYGTLYNSAAPGPGISQGLGLTSTIGGTYTLGDKELGLGFRAILDAGKINIHSYDLGVVLTVGKKVSRNGNFKVRHPGLSKFIESLQ